MHSDEYSEELRRRFVKAETTLFKLRFINDDHAEQEAFLSSRNFDWVLVSPLIVSICHRDERIVGYTRRGTGVDPANEWRTCGQIL